MILVAVVLSLVTPCRGADEEAEVIRSEREPAP